MRSVKVPLGSIERARKLGILSEYLFYYELKSCRSDGFFGKGEILNMMRGRMSDNTIYKRIKALFNLGLIRKDDNGHSLTKYDNLFEVLGYDLSPVYVGGKVSRYGKFRILKIERTGIGSIEDDIVYGELKDNADRQMHMINNKSTQNKPMDTVDKRINISCIGLAKTLGYNSKSSGHKWETRLRDLGYIIIIPHKELLEVNPLIIRGIELKRGMVIEDGMLYRVHNNELSMEI